tara:strand:+ start:498 stop:665 length:168 start_codon:yes stop_codon:yes gene_type:complete
MSIRHNRKIKIMITAKEYIEHKMNVRNQFYSVGNIKAAEMVQKDIDALILEEVKN